MSRIVDFYQKLHSQEITLEHIREVHQALLQEWKTMRDDTHPLSASIEAMFRSVENYHLALSPLVTAAPIRETIENDCRHIESWITGKQFRALPSGYGARVGVVLHTKDRYIFNISNRGLLSDFGGGVRAKRTPYEGLVKELYEECPQWVDYILARLDRIHCVESFHRYDEEYTRRHMRFSIVIFVRMEPTLLDSFKKTREVRALVKIAKSEIQQVICSRRVNSGLLHMQKYKVYS